MSGLQQVIAIAVFWVPPIFLAVWLAPLKRTDAKWALLGWLGLAIMASRPSREDVDPERARNRSLLCGFLGVTGLLAGVGWVIYEQNHQPIDINSTVQSMQSDFAYVDCSKEGWILVGGHRDDVYGCVAKDGTNRGCYAREGNAGMLDVTDQAKSIAGLGGAKLPCAS
jgi:hypothetical protein